MLTEWGLRTHLDGFAGILATLMSQRSGKLNLTAGILGPPGIVADCWWGFLDFGVTPCVCYGDAAAGHYIETLPVTELGKARLDILFTSEAWLTPQLKSLLSVLVTNGQLVALIDIDSLTRVHCQILESLESQNFSTCLSVRKLTTLALAAFLAPNRGWAIEGGTYFGGSATYLAKMFQAINRKVPIATFDTFEGIPAPHEKDGATIYEEGQFANTSYGEVLRRFQSCNVSDLIHPIKGMVQDVAESSLADVTEVSLVFLDFDHYKGTKYLLEHLMPKMVPGCIIVLDDAQVEGVDAAITEILADHPSLMRLRGCASFDILINGGDLFAFCQKNLVDGFATPKTTLTTDYL